MKWRGITINDVKSVIRDPERRTRSVKGRVNLWRLVGGSLLKVTVSEAKTNTIVVTVIRKE